MCIASVLPPDRSDVGIAELPPMVINRQALSEIARPTHRIMPVTMPGMAAGRTTYRMVCHLVAPSANEASRSERGIALIASSVVRIRVGSSRHARVSAPDRMEKLKCNTVTKSANPNSPKTMEGMPASVSIP
jgi:hypothetical protein